MDNHFNFGISITPFSPFRHLQAAGKNNPPATKVERLVLHQSSPSHSLSSPSHSEQGVGLRLKTEGLSTSLGLQRPETSRGRLVRASNTQLEDAEPLLQESPQEEEPSRRLRKDREKKEMEKEQEEEEERKRTEREERNLRERKEEKERERRKADREVEEEREHLVKEKEKRMRLLQEELRREEEEEERKLKVESEERLR